ncbi:reverse transcriptase domain-containing protein [Tanacetum coccineum]
MTSLVPFLLQWEDLKFLSWAMTNFTKWIEAKAVATIIGNQVKRFVWDNIVCRFGLPGEIVSDNGKQFGDNPFKDWWVEELSHVLWAHRTTIKVSTGDTPFSLVYGTEAVIPAEIGMPTIRTAEVNIATNDDERRIDLDILEERREPHNIALPFTPFFLASLMAWASKDSFNGISFSSAKGLRMSRGQAKIGTCSCAIVSISFSSSLSQQQAPHMHYHYIQVPVRQALSATSFHAVPPLLPPYHVPMHTSQHPQRTA